MVKLGPFPAMSRWAAPLPVSVPMLVMLASVGRLEPAIGSVGMPRGPKGAARVITWLSAGMMPSVAGAAARV
jgi:hypothetical protein